MPIWRCLDQTWCLMNSCQKMQAPSLPHSPHPGLNFSREAMGMPWPKGIILRNPDLQAEQAVLIGCAHGALKRGGPGVAEGFDVFILHRRQIEVPSSKVEVSLLLSLMNGNATEVVFLSRLSSGGMFENACGSVLCFQVRQVSMMWICRQGEWLWWLDTASIHHLCHPVK